MLGTKFVSSLARLKRFPCVARTIHTQAKDVYKPLQLSLWRFPQVGRIFTHQQQVRLLHNRTYSSMQSNALARNSTNPTKQASIMSNTSIVSTSQRMLFRTARVLNEGDRKTPEKKEEETTTPLTEEEERAAMKKELNRQETIHNMIAPERNWGLTHPMTFVMLVLICVLQYLNSQKSKRKEEAELEEARRMAKLRGGKPYVKPELQDGWE
ncbi:hypothetical protein SARC_04710 [Sphaeroforma arctica JP610]|uniref:Uncharacterized protein n=1 Tax=Sphaeroforma arctica JP610 TaxID=667725 RepID=A0A0L0G2G9_9EUKA|nr:hypothetical protein SARC_04710 [Sphaeroforma arctica JP610]KNC83021.1 hypothetical protein SARC_04710 [Sphaeroforma arctica JP610]|eukprot:XP_014156923.1 hypothetical protein SARC_04710 [Sphaeroforma arctica JP610]